MNARTYKYILVFISAVIVCTIALQSFWNYRNYQEHNRQIKNEIQLSFNEAIESYYAGEAKKNYFAIIPNTDAKGYTYFNERDSSKVNTDVEITRIEVNLDDQKKKGKTDSIFESLSKFYNKPSKGLSVFKKPSNTDSLLQLSPQSKFNYIRGKRSIDSLKLIRDVKSIIVSFQSDSIQYSKMDSIVADNLKQKDINIAYAIKHSRNDSVLFVSNNAIPLAESIKANNTYLKPSETLELNYNAPNSLALSKSMSGIVMSGLLIISTVFCLFYLVHIINKQKELAEMKNDFISNITHEFKTPITTIGVALESIQNFKTNNLTEYLKLSNLQLNKLEIMVEKLLETSMLDKSEITLKNEAIDLNKLITAVALNFRNTTKTKNFEVNIIADLMTVYGDKFHLENAINNLVDNAVKHGGDDIIIQLEKNKDYGIISVSDSGNGIKQSDLKYIFNKFYRIPKGNTHDVKGFGIGLYYAKTIIEKHKGTITVDLKKKLTTFKVKLPYV